MKIKKFQSIWVLLIFVVMILLIIVPGFVREKNNSPYFSDPGSYYSLRIISQIAYTSVINFDSLQEEDLNLNIYLISLGFLSMVVPLKILVILIPILFSLGSLVILFFLLKKVLPVENKLLTLSFIVISPIWIFVFSNLNSFSLSFLLALLGFLVFTGKRSYLAFLFFGLLALVDIPLAIISTLFVLAYCLAIKDKIRSFYFVLVSTVALSCYYFFTNTVLIDNYFFNPAAKVFFSELGALMGVSIPLFILGVIGFIISWKKDTKYLTYYTTFILLFVGSFFILSLKLFLLIILATYSGVAINYFLKRRWSYKTMKNLTLLLILCSFLFSTFSYISLQVDNKPNNEFLQGLNLLNTYPDISFANINNPAVLSSFENTFLIQYFSHKKTFLTGFFDGSPKGQKKDQLIANLYTSRNLQNTISLMEKSGIGVFVIDKSMMEDIWENRDDGLVFLLKNSENFINIYSSQNIDIWAYVG